MHAFPAQYVFPPPPAELLVLLGVILVIWVVIRVINDARTWFKDEILDDSRAPAKKSGKTPVEERAKAIRGESDKEQ